MFNTCVQYHDLWFRARKLGKEKFVSSFCTKNGIVKIEIKELESPHIIRHVYFRDIYFFEKSINKAPVVFFSDTMRIH